MPNFNFEKGDKIVPLTDRDYRKAQQLEITANMRRGGIGMAANKAALERIERINREEDENRTAKTDD